MVRTAAYRSYINGDLPVGKAGEAFNCAVYCQFLDKKMVDVFKGTDIDYLIWYTPFKHYGSTCPLNFQNCAYMM